MLSLAGEKRPATEPSRPAARVAPPFVLVDVTVASIPSGARIEVERTPAGHTAANVKLQPGEYRFRLTLDGYETWEQRVTIRSEGTNRITAELQRKAVPAGAPRSGLSESKATNAPTPVPVIRSDGGVASSEAPVGSDTDEAPQASAAPQSAGQQRADKELHVGPRGGVYHYSKSGKKVYEKRK